MVVALDGFFTFFTTRSTGPSNILQLEFFIDELEVQAFHRVVGVTALGVIVLAVNEQLTS